MSFTVGEPAAGRPAEEIDFQGCEPQPSFREVFRYEATRDVEDNSPSVVWLDDLAHEAVVLNIPGDGGECHGNFERYGVDGDERTLITLKPVLQPDGTLLGVGAWTLYEDRAPFDTD